MQEHELGDLGIFRIPIPIPFPQAGGPVNAYIVEEERGLLLFDPGLGTVSSQAALAEGLALTGHRFDEVNRIVLSHGHMDHFGAAAWALEQIGRAVPISIHSADADKVLESGLDSYGKRVRVVTATGERLAETAGIDPSGALRVRDEDGREGSLVAGEVVEVK